MNGSVRIQDRVYFTKTSVLPNYLHTIAAQRSNQLSEISIKIYSLSNHPIDYKSMAAGCVSHHGQYLALVY